LVNNFLKTKDYKIFNKNSSTGSYGGFVKKKNTASLHFLGLSDLSFPEG
jgi:hypothetical protein